MNTFNDAQYDSVCDENEELREKLIEAKGQLLICKAELAKERGSLGMARALLREAVDLGEWMDGMFHTELDGNWMDRAKGACGDK